MDPVGPTRISLLVGSIQRSNESLRFNVMVTACDDLDESVSVRLRPATWMQMDIEHGKFIEFNGVDQYRG